MKRRSFIGKASAILAGVFLGPKQMEGWKPPGLSVLRCCGTCRHMETCVSINAVPDGGMVGLTGYCPFQPGGKPAAKQLGRYSDFAVVIQARPPFPEANVHFLNDCPRWERRA